MKILKKGILSATVGFVNGFFASGGGVIAVLLLKHIYKLDTKKAHAGAIAVTLPLSIASAIFYCKGGYADISLIIKAVLGGVAGAILGAKLLPKIKKEYISLVFGIVMIAAGVRMFLR